MKKEQNPVCDPCERNFEHNVNELVREGKAPSRMERMKKEHEVKTAFGHTTTHSAKDPKTEKHPAAKAGAAKPGMAKMKK